MQFFLEPISSLYREAGSPPPFLFLSILLFFFFDGAKDDIMNIIRLIKFN